MSDTPDLWNLWRCPALIGMSVPESLTRRASRRSGFDGPLRAALAHRLQLNADPGLPGRARSTGQRA